MEYLTVSQWAALVGVTAETARRWAREGVIKAATLPNGRYRIPASEAERLLRAPGKPR